MSPEQAEMTTLDIDTRTDIYSLGVLLYELLTGKPPLDNHQLLAVGLDEMRRIIREEEPTPPSSLSTLNPHLSTDLDSIVLKCLEKDRTRRYQSAIEPALDIERHLRNEPVTARPPTRLYQFQKLIRRNKVAVTPSAAVAAALIMGTAISTWLYFRERAALRIAAINANVAESGAQREAQQRIHAEEALTRREVETAELYFAQNDSSRALAYLARLLRQQPTNRVVAQRILSALSQRNFCVPITPPLKHGPPLKPGRPWDPKARIHPALNGSITAARFSPDGESVLTASRDGTAIIWNVRTGEPLLAPFRHDDEVLSATFSSDGKSIVTACRNHRAYLWSTVDGRLITDGLMHDGPVIYAEFSPDGDRVVTASGDGTAKVWSTPIGQLIAGPLEHADALTTAQFSDDGRWILTASYDKCARVWDAKTGVPRSPPFKQFNALPTADFSPDGEKVAAGCLNWMVNIWKPTSAVPILVTPAHHGILLATVFTPDSRLLLSAGEDGKVRFSDANEGKVLPRFIKHNAAVNSLAISSNGKIVATASHDTTARLWDIDTALPVTEPINHDSPVVLVSLSPDAHRLLTISQNDEALVWKVRPQPSPISEFPHGLRPLALARFSLDGRFVVTMGTGNDQNAKLWEFGTATLISALRTHSRYMTSVDFSPNGKLVATASLDGTAKIWDIVGTRFLLVLRHASVIATVRFHPNRQLILSAANDGTAKIWDFSGKVIAEVEHGKYFEAAADFAPYGEHFVTASRHGTADIWDTETGKRIGRSLQHDHDINFVQYSHDGAKIVTASKDKTVRIWSSRSGEPIGPPFRHEEEVISARFNSRDTRVVTCFGSAARLWDVQAGLPSTDLRRHGARVKTPLSSVPMANTSLPVPMMAPRGFGMRPPAIRFQSRCVIRMLLHRPSSVRMADGS